MDDATGSRPYAPLWRQLQLPWAPVASSAPQLPLAMPGHGHAELAQLEEALSHHTWQPVDGDEELWLRLSALLATLPLKSTLVVPASLKGACCDAAVAAIAAKDGDVDCVYDAIGRWGEAVAQASEATGFEESARDAMLLAFAQILLPCEQPAFLLGAFGVPRGWDAFDDCAAAERLGRLTAQEPLECLPALFHECERRACDPYQYGDAYDGWEAFGILRGWAQVRGQRMPSALGPEQLSLLLEALMHCISLAPRFSSSSIPEVLCAPWDSWRDPFQFRSQMDSGSLGRLLVDLRLPAAQLASLFSQLALEEASHPQSPKWNESEAEAKQRRERTLLRSLLDDGTPSRQERRAKPLFGHSLELLRQWACAAYFWSWPVAERARLLKCIAAGGADAETAAKTEAAAGT
eukprot:7383825-Prymnesium_polylepis.2